MEKEREIRRIDEEKDVREMLKRWRNGKKIENGNIDEFERNNMLKRRKGKKECEKIEMSGGKKKMEGIKWKRNVIEKM